MSLAIALCVLVLATSRFGNYDPLSGVDDLRQSAVQTLHAYSGVLGKPSGDGGHEEALVTGLGGFIRSDPRPTLTTLFHGLSSKLLAPAFDARAPPAPHPLVIG